MNSDIILVTGAGGFIGGHLVKELLERGERVRAVDLKPPGEWHQLFPEAENLSFNLEERSACNFVMKGVGTVYNLSANMGGMGFIESNKALCALSVLINTHLLLAAKDARVKRYFFASSACVYNADKQRSVTVIPLKEEDAYPAEAEDGYGWEKLFSERMCRHFREDFGLPTRIARFHNVYGPHGTFEGGREKAPAALCRKVAEAVLSSRKEIEIWGTGEQTRSFMWIGDCIKGIFIIANGDFTDPLNLGSSELVSVNQLVDIIEKIAQVKLVRWFNPTAPRGVMGRNSDNTLIKKVYDFEPSTPLRVGLERTYRWIYDELAKRAR